MNISVQELKDRLEDGEDLHLIDVREEHEYEEDNIGALLIPLGELPDRIEELRTGKTKKCWCTAAQAPVASVPKSFWKAKALPTYAT